MWSSVRVRSSALAGNKLLGANEKTADFWPCLLFPEKWSTTSGWPLWRRRKLTILKTRSDSRSNSHRTHKEWEWPSHNCDSDDSWLLVDYWWLLVFSRQLKRSLRLRMSLHRSRKDRNIYIRLKEKKSSKQNTHFHIPSWHGRSNENSIEIHFHKQRSNFQVLEYQPVLSIVEMFGYMGGYIGIWLGFSLLSILLGLNRLLSNLYEKRRTEVCLWVAVAIALVLALVLA